MEVLTLSMNKKHIVIQLNTVEELDKRKHTGQSYNGVIQELLLEKKPLQVA